MDDWNPVALSAACYVQYILGARDICGNEFRLVVVRCMRSVHCRCVQHAITALHGRSYCLCVSYVRYYCHRFASDEVNPDRLGPEASERTTQRRAKVACAARDHDPLPGECIRMGRVIALQRRHRRDGSLALDMLRELVQPRISPTQRVQVHACLVQPQLRVGRQRR